MPSARPGGEETHGPFRSEPGALLEHVPVAVFGLDDGDLVCRWGPGARDLFGCDATAVLSKPGTVLFADGPPGAPDPCSRPTERGRARGHRRGAAAGPASLPHRLRLRLPGLLRDRIRRTFGGDGPGEPQ
ncbi:hypothetical protein GCM10010275_67090 [Streptomyces litmocidini]|nr:hypothetical protein GCM10010275_67090 [Streptomyces litmocidini]